MKTRIVTDTSTLFIKVERFTDHVIVPKPGGLLTLSKEERQKSVTARFTGATATGGTVLSLYGQRRQIEKCQLLYNDLLLLPSNMGASHNCAAFKLYNPEDSV